MRRCRLRNNASSNGLQLIANSYLSLKPFLPQYLKLCQILTKKQFKDSIIPSEREQFTRRINIICLLRWLCEDLNKILSFSSYQRDSYNFAILIFRLFELNLFDQILTSQSTIIQQRKTSAPYRMSFQQVFPCEQNISQQIDQNQSNNQYLSIIYQQRQKSNTAAIESSKNIQGECFQFVSINSRYISSDILSGIKQIEKKRINFTNNQQGLKIIIANLALNLRRQIRKVELIMEIQCEECRRKIQLRLYLLSALILPHSVEKIKIINQTNPKESLPLQFFNKSLGIAQLYAYLVEIGSTQLNNRKKFLSSLISP